MPQCFHRPSTAGISSSRLHVQHAPPCNTLKHENTNTQAVSAPARCCHGTQPLALARRHTSQVKARAGAKVRVKPHV
jgi:hypothetical protein